MTMDEFILIQATIDYHKPIAMASFDRIMESICVRKLQFMILPL
jgi:hypothetical protein